MRKQTIFLLTCYSFFLISCGDESPNRVIKKGNSEKVVHYIDYNNGNIKAVTEDSNKVPNGLTTYYDSNEVVHRKEMYINGLKDGFEEVYGNNGQLVYKGFNKKGKTYGVCKWYYETGELKSLEYFRNGVICWDSYDYYQNGKVKVHAFADVTGQFNYRADFGSTGNLVKEVGIPIFVTWNKTIAPSEDLELGVFVTANPEFINNCSISLIDSKGNSVDLVRNEAIKEDHSDGFAKRLVVRHKIQDKGNYTLRVTTHFFTSSSPKAKMKYSKDLKVTVE